MKHWILILNLMVAVGLNVGCKSVYAPIKTMAEVGLEVRWAYAELYVDGLVPPPAHAKALQADEEYLRAQRALRVLLEEGAAVGAEPDVTAALLRAKEALVPIIEIVGEYVSANRARQLRTDLNQAKAQ
jgi:hypothetical protein